jgi:hypothetical protein
VSVSADDIRDVINVTSEEVPDDKILKIIKRAEVMLELETDKTVDSSNCSARIPEQRRIRSHCGSRGYNQVGEDASHSWFPDIDERLLILEERVTLYSILLEC